MNHRQHPYIAEQRATERVSSSGGKAILLIAAAILFGFVLTLPYTFHMEHTGVQARADGCGTHTMARP